MVSSDVWDEHSAAVYDEEAAEMFAPEVVDPAVDFLAALAGSGPALAFAIGTGRIGIPLVQRGVPVVGIELSAPMAARLRAKISEVDLPVVVGDMATTRVPGEFSLVFLVWNSISNLRTQSEQVECFRNAARHLSPGGRFVIELFVPSVRRCVGFRRASWRCPSRCRRLTQASTPSTSRTRSARHITTSDSPTAPCGTTWGTSATSGPLSAT